MKLYELVAIIDPQLSQEDQQSIITQIESAFPESCSIEQKDEIAAVIINVPPRRAEWNGTARFRSRAVPAPPAPIHHKSRAAPHAEIFRSANRAPRA